MIGTTTELRPPGSASQGIRARIPQSAPASTRRRIVLLAVQAVVFLALAGGFHLENPAFYRQILPLALSGAVLNHLLPLRLRPLFFSVLSAAGILIVFGLAPAAWLMGIGAALIGLTFLPVPFRFRVLLLAGAACVLAAMRAGWLRTPWPGGIWPVLASMFMFRLAMYVYDVRHHGASARQFVFPYFFALPNVVFPFFPVIDFRTFCRTYYDRPALEIYEEGCRWMYRGLAHLVLYRVIYQHAALPPTEVTTTVDLVRYLVANYALYLRVSGLFHLIVGMLHLFGFRLPETHRFFYLASSFTDLWRRINIYWKDAMQKFIFLPVFFGVRRRGEAAAHVVATVSVVAATWWLHTYQWFWLLGEWLFSSTDVLFWTIIGGFLVANTLIEQRRQPRPRATSRHATDRGLWKQALRTAGMFALMCLLWGLWTSPTLDEYLVLLRAVTIRPVDVVTVGAVLGLVAAAAALVRRLNLDAPLDRPHTGWMHPLVVVALPLSLLWISGQPAPIFTQLIYSQAAPLVSQLPIASAARIHGAEREVEESLLRHVPVRIREALRDIRVDALNRHDAERLQRGYYETLLGVNRFSGQLWEMYVRREREANDGLGVMGGMTIRPDSLQTELFPYAAIVFKGGIFRTNRWGMRDRDYAHARAEGTVRIALLGQSYVMGPGVNDGETFEALIEERLNRERTPAAGRRFESLNFAVPNYTLLQQAILMENGRVAAFTPDVVLVIAHPTDLLRLSDYLLREVRFGRTYPDARIARYVREAGIDANMSALEASRRLRPYTADIARVTFARIADAAARRGMRPVLVLLPLPGDRVDPDDRLLLFSSARDSGFRLIDLEHVYDGHNPADLWLSAADRHPNALGHRVIADGLYPELVKVLDESGP